MSKPIVEITVTTPPEKSSRVKAVFDSGSFYSFIREDRVPPGSTVLKRREPRAFRSASKGKILATGEVPVILTIGDKEVEDVAFVSADLAPEMVVGVGLMQKWDISIVSRNGRTEVVVGRDMSEPDLDLV